MQRIATLSTYLPRLAGLLSIIGLTGYILNRRAHFTPRVAPTRRKMADSALENKSLPDGAVTELEKVAKWLRSPDANFQITDNVKICNNTNGLAAVTADFLQKFAKEVPVCVSESRVTAIHFDSPTTVPVDAGWVVYLVPIHVLEGPVTVEGRPLSPNSYIHLATGASVSGGFFGLLLLFHLG
ncbi:hypothetical protein F4803DRAFT_528205 [Xylaria telfairii]|nr:hypothetical protein F4803DRAFT_528205 [Xylaria telfairii]